MATKQNKVRGAAVQDMALVILSSLDTEHAISVRAYFGAIAEISAANRTGSWEARSVAFSVFNRVRRVAVAALARVDAHVAAAGGIQMRLA